MRWKIVLSVAGLMGLVLLLNASAGVAADAGYIVFKVGEQGKVFAKIEGAELRLAATAADLGKAQAIKGRAANRVVRFPETELPVAKDALPDGMESVLATIMVYPMQNNRLYVRASVSQSMKDAQNATWTYLSSVGGMLAAQAEGSPAIPLPEIKAGTIEVVAKKAANGLGVGLRVKSGGAELAGIKKDGKDVPAQIKIVNGAKELASASGPISQFGFG